MPPALFSADTVKPFPACNLYLSDGHWNEAADDIMVEGNVITIDYAGGSAADEPLGAPSPSDEPQGSGYRHRYEHKRADLWVRKVDVHLQGLTYTRPQAQNHRPTQPLLPD